MNQYECVYETKEKLYARIFNSDTQTSELKQYQKSEWIPPLYLPAKEGEYTSHVKDSMILKEYRFTSLKDYREFHDRYVDSQLILHGNKSIVQHYIRTNFPDTQGSNHEVRTWHLDIETRNEIKDVSFNIKADKASEKISLIQLYDTFDKEFYILATKDYPFDYKSEFGKINFLVYDSEFDMMKAFVNLMKEKDPLVLNGFNTYGFDYPYIIKRLKILGIKPEHMSPVGIINERPATNKDGIEYTHYDILGRILLDYRELYLKYSFNRLPRYNLESICNSELGEGKVNHDEYTDFEDFYNNDYKTFLEYGVRDIELLIMLESKLKLIETAKSIAYMCGVNIPDVFGTYKQWHAFMYNEAIKTNIVLPIKQQYRNESDGFPGGWVVSNPGKYEWIISFDYNSLYPKTSEALNYGLDTLVKPEEEPQELKDLREKYFSWYTFDNCEKLKELNNNPNEHENLLRLIENREEIHQVLSKYNVVASPNGYFYRKDKQSLFGSIISKLYSQRVEAKNNMKKHEVLMNKALEINDEEEAQRQKMLIETNDLAQYVLKIFLNSCYGSLSMEINTFSHGHGFSAAITSGGRLANRLANHYVSNFIAKANGSQNTNGYEFSKQCDTDSVLGDTKIIVNGKRISIEDYYDSLTDSEFLKNDVENNNFIKKVSNDTALSCSNDLTIKDNRVLHIMKHRVTKGFYTIKLNGKSVTITEDHSIMVLRNNELISITPKDILKTDKLITIKDKQ